VVTVGGHEYNAAVNGNTWSAQVTSVLSQGIFNVSVAATDAAGNVGNDASNNELTIDTTAPVVTVASLVTTDTTPTLTGAIDDLGATIVVTVGGHQYTAMNNGDGTWTAAVTQGLNEGRYDVAVTATDAAGNSGSDSSTGELAVAETRVVYLGGSVHRVTYYDADNTKVTIACGTGSVAATLTGINLNVTGKGSLRTVQSLDGVLAVDLEVRNAVKNVVFTTSGGDGWAELNSVTGAGRLTNLSAPTVDLIGGGIDMTNMIDTVGLHNVQADVRMNNANRGVNFTFDTLHNSNINVGLIKGLTVNTAFVNSNITASRIVKAALHNVNTNNHSQHFGITASTIDSLKLVQPMGTLTWGKDFQNSLGDFMVQGQLGRPRRK
jgi:hypothetical protein